MKHLYDQYGRYLPSEDKDYLHDFIISTILPVVLEMEDNGYSKIEILAYINNILDFEVLNYRLLNSKGDNRKCLNIGGN